MPVTASFTSGGTHNLHLQLQIYITVKTEGEIYISNLITMYSFAIDDDVRHIMNTISNIL
jgi:uncharacterized protein YwgA